MEHVADEAGHKELGDRLVRDATTAFSLEVEHDSGGPRCQEAMRDTTAQTRIESLDNEESLGEDASKHERRIDAIDADKDITLVNVQDDAEMFDVDDLGGEEVFVAEQEVVSTAATTKTVTTEELTLAQALKALKTSKPKNMEGYTLKQLKSFEFDKIQEMFAKAFKRVNTFEDFRTELVQGKEKRAGEELIQESTKKQKVEDDKETTELKQLIEIISNKEEVAIDVIPLTVKSPGIVDWKIYKEGKKSYYQIIRVDGKSQMYMVFSKMLESFNREDLVDLYKSVKAKFKSTRLVKDLD
nr:hypothetical protein [Tanacetum cinerariifolium]